MPSNSWMKSRVRILSAGASFNAAECTCRAQSRPGTPQQLSSACHGPFPADAYSARRRLQASVTGWFLVLLTGVWDPGTTLCPYYLQAMLPGHAAHRAFEVHLQGWDAAALYTVMPQTINVSAPSAALTVSH